MPPSSHLSMRASCDRCRFHKLKCVLSSEESPSRHECARCIRAKVKCVYSPRAPARRRKIVVSEKTSQTFSCEGFGPPTPLTDSPSTGEEDFGDAALSHSHAYSLFTFDSPALDQPVVPALSTAGQVVSDTALHESLFGSHTPQSVLQQVGQDLRFGLSTTHPPSMCESQQLQAHIHLVKPPTTTATRISNLVAEIHKTLALLPDNCRGSRYPNFNLREYPVGTVLHLAQDLIDIVSKFKPASEAPTTPDISTSLTTLAHYTTASSTGGDSAISTLLNQEFYPDLISPDPTLSSTSCVHDNVMDTPTKLLAMGCYFSLRRLYYVVFTHFEGYLSTKQQAPSSRGQLADNLAKGRELQVGELLSTDEMCSSIKTAVRLMLEVLQCADNVLSILEVVGTEFDGLGSKLVTEGEAVEILTLIDSPNPIGLGKLPKRMYDFLENLGIFGAFEMGAETKAPLD
ncbi:uncharacterized protein N7487_011819 [Penicillium crustosum]|uniref:uncharacterized protein n=1 Tax=Penicillium crustosum TaxID=36656 RepID=UPI00239220C9|nr:uncharacterized protein N7487_011819 [Penicillium crustosum]KAJ5394178.1 hypothetical protein N7487_011819 [Penicillium crustosum]